MTNSRVEKLVIARHGEYHADGTLTERGRADAYGLANQIRLFMGEEYLGSADHVTSLASSEADRAQETARILAEVLGLSVIVEGALGDTAGKEFRGEWVAEQLAYLTNWHRGFIAVTHDPQTNYLPQYLHSKVKGDIGRVGVCAWANGFDSEGNKYLITPEKIGEPYKRRGR
jgi:broad specificity phosphatase PhoE